MIPLPPPFAQDTRDVQIFGGQLYAAIDTKEGTGSKTVTTSGRSVRQELHRLVWWVRRYALAGFRQ